MWSLGIITCLIFFFFNDPPTTEIYPLSLHDALPIFHATSNRTAGHAGDPRHHAQTVGAGLSGGKPPPPPFIQNRRQFSVTSSNTGCRPDHPQKIGRAHV